MQRADGGKAAEQSGGGHRGDHVDPSPARRLLWVGCWLALVVAGAAATMLTVRAFNTFVHGALVNSRGERRLRIMTWNIGKIYLPVDSRASDKDLAHVARVIEEVDPQIVALQELKDPRQLGRLLAALGPAWRGRLPRDAYDRRAALLTRLPARFIELETSTGRIAQAADVTLPGGERVTVASVHLDAFDAERRTRQAEEILAAVSRLGNEEVFIAGDFNFDPTAVARDSLDYRLYLFLTRELTDAGHASGGTTVTSQRLDYVFYRCSRVQTVRDEVLRDRRINIMDHDPLVVELALRPGSVTGAPRRDPPQETR